MNVTSTGGFQKPAGQAFAQVDDRDGARRSNAGNGSGTTLENPGMYGGGVQADFTSLINLITTTIQPDSWEELSGPGSVMPYKTTLSLVIRQTQAIHEEIADLLGQLRRLQDLQVTVECRFVTVSDNFFERIGINFNWNLPPTSATACRTRSGSRCRRSASARASPRQRQGQRASRANPNRVPRARQGPRAAPPARPVRLAADRLRPVLPSIRPTTTTGRATATSSASTRTNTFTNDLNIPFRQGSFSIGVPKFGGFDPTAGLSVGFAILSDIETFFLINAAQGDTRNNLLFAPKITLFNGQMATVTDTVQQPFVTSLTPTVGFFSVGFQPQITVLPQG